MGRSVPLCFFFFLLFTERSVPLSGLFSSESNSMCIHTYRRKCLGISTIVYGGALGNQRMFCTAGVGCLPQGVENLSQVAMAADT